MSELNTQVEPTVFDEDLSGVTVMVVPEAADGSGMSDDPLAGIEDLKRQFSEADAARKAEQSRNAELQRQVEAERTARTAAEQMARTAQGNASASQQQALENQYAQVVNGLQAAKTQQQALTEKFAELNEAGKFKEAAQLQAQLGEVGARVIQYADAKVELDAYVQNLQNQSASPPPPPPPPATAQPSVQQQQEQFLSRIPPKSAEWIRAHPQYFSDAGFRAKVNAAASYLEQVKGLNDRSPSYFTQLEADVGLAAAAGQQQRNPQQDTRRGPMAAAPVNRTLPGGTGSGRTYQLTQAEMDHARATMTPEICGKDKEGRPISPEVAYARQKERNSAAGLGPDAGGTYRPGMYKTISRGGR